MKSRQSKDLVNIGKVGSSCGLRGEVRVDLHAQDSDNLKEGKVLLLKRADSHAADLEAAIVSVRRQNGRPVIMLEGISDRTAADSLRGMEIHISADQLEDLPEGEHYVRDIIGCEVRDLASGRTVGTLRDVIQNTAQSILDVETPEGGQVMIPAVDAFMRGIDEEAGLITVELIPGFLSD